jgi:hypothetical protein
MESEAGEIEQPLCNTGPNYLSLLDSVSMNRIQIDQSRIVHTASEQSVLFAHFSISPR